MKENGFAKFPNGKYFCQMQEGKWNFKILTTVNYSKIYIQSKNQILCFTVRAC